MDRFLESALAEIDRAAGHLPAAIIVRPVEGRWSIAQILEHLTLAFTVNRAALEKALASGELRARPPGPRHRFGRLLVVDIGYFPRRKSPDMTTPRGSVPPERAVAALREALAALDETLTRVAARFGETAPVANHPYFSGMNVRQWRKFHWRHTRHHMKQVRARGRV
jgi:hypothetical protein